MMKDFAALFILPKIFMILVKFFEILFYMYVALAVCFTSDNLSSYFKDEPFYVKTAVYTFENVRYNLRILAGTVIQIDPNIYKGISSEQKKLMPQFDEGGFKLNPVQHLGVKLMSLQIKQLEKQALVIYFGSKEFYKRSKLKNLDLTPVRDIATTLE